jgi:hypothetical protein
MSQEDETIAVALAFELLQEDCMNDELLAVYMQQDQGTWTRVHEPCNTSLNTAAATLEEARYGYGHPPSPCSMHYLAEPSLSSPSPSPPSVQDMTGDVLLAALLQDAENGMELCLLLQDSYTTMMLFFSHRGTAIRRRTICQRHR